MERLVKHLQEKTHTDAFPLNSHNLAKDLASMASDPDIQTEIATINEEFAVAEMDGWQKL